MVDELGLAWCSGSLGQVMLVHHHIDQGRFAHIAPAEKREFGPVRLWTFVDIRAGDEVIGCDDIHE
jgi:hypothetical protein